MIYAAILAGGIGKRMRRDDDLPKQFLPLGDECVLSFTTRKFVENTNIDHIYVLVPGGWVSYVKDALSKMATAAAAASAKDIGITVIQGGDDRNSTLMAAVGDIENTRGITSGDIIVTHDAVRPFLTKRIINENISECQKFGVVDTIYPMSDTPVISDDAQTVRDIPVRSNYYVSQTPQTFNISLLKEVYSSLTDEEKMTLTDACKMFILKNKTVGIVIGESYNIKITTPFDYVAASAYIGACK